MGKSTISTGPCSMWLFVCLPGRVYRSLPPKKDPDSARVYILKRNQLVECLGSVNSGPNPWAGPVSIALLSSCEKY